MRMTYDSAADAAYVYLVPAIEAGEVARTQVAGGFMHPDSVNLDFDGDGRLLGIEILGAARVLRAATLRGAEDITERR